MCGLRSREVVDGEERDEAGCDVVRLKAENSAIEEELRVQCVLDVLSFAKAVLLPRVPSLFWGTLMLSLGCFSAQLIARLF